MGFRFGNWGFMVTIPHEFCDKRIGVKNWLEYYAA